MKDNYSNINFLSYKRTTIALAFNIPLELGFEISIGLTGIQECGRLLLILLTVTQGKLFLIYIEFLPREYLKTAHDPLETGSHKQTNPVTPHQHTLEPQT